MKAANEDAHQNQEHSLEHIFKNTDAESAPKRQKCLADNERRRGDHRNAEICLTANGDAERDKNGAEKPQKLGRFFDLHKKPFLDSKNQLSRATSIELR